MNSVDKCTHVSAVIHARTSTLQTTASRLEGLIINCSSPANRHYVSRILTQD